MALLAIEQEQLAGQDVRLGAACSAGTAGDGDEQQRQQQQHQPPPRHQDVDQAAGSAAEPKAAGSRHLKALEWQAAQRRTDVRSSRRLQLWRPRRASRQPPHALPVVTECLLAAYILLLTCTAGAEVPQQVGNA